MPLKKKNKVTVLKYKTLFEENELVSVESSDGAADLAYHLNFFKKKLKKEIANQDQRFKNLFFDDFDVPSEQAHLTQKDNTISKQVNTKIQKPDWAKKLYKKIVFITHPDKLERINIEVLVGRLKRLYHVASDAYKKGNFQDLLMVCYELDINFDESLIDEQIKPQVAILERKISIEKKTLGYQWYHIKEKDRPSALEQYLIKLGFVFTKEEVDIAIKNVRQKNKRKVGTKPVNRSRMRLK